MATPQPGQPKVTSPIPSQGTSSAASNRARGGRGRGTVSNGSINSMYAFLGRRVPETVSTLQVAEPQANAGAECQETKSEPPFDGLKQVTKATNALEAGRRHIVAKRKVADETQASINAVNLHDADSKLLSERANVEVKKAEMPSEAVGTDQKSEKGSGRGGKKRRGREVVGSEKEIELESGPQARRRGRPRKKTLDVAQQSLQAVDPVADELLEGPVGEFNSGDDHPAARNERGHERKIEKKVDKGQEEGFIVLGHSSQNRMIKETDQGHANGKKMEELGAGGGRPQMEQSPAQNGVGGRGSTFQKGTLTIEPCCDRKSAPGMRVQNHNDSENKFGFSRQHGADDDPEAVELDGALARDCCPTPGSEEKPLAGQDASTSFFMPASERRKLQKQRQEEEAQRLAAAKIKEEEEQKRRAEIAAAQAEESQKADALAKKPARRRRKEAESGVKQEGEVLTAGERSLATRRQTRARNAKLADSPNRAEVSEGSKEDGKGAALPVANGNFSEKPLAGAGGGEGKGDGELVPKQVASRQDDLKTLATEQAEVGQMGDVQLNTGPHTVENGMSAEVVAGKGSEAVADEHKVFAADRDKEDGSTPRREHEFFLPASQRRRLQKEKEEKSSQKLDEALKSPEERTKVEQTAPKAEGATAVGGPSQRPKRRRKEKSDEDEDYAEPPSGRTRKKQEAFSVKVSARQAAIGQKGMQGAQQEVAPGGEDPLVLARRQADELRAEARRAAEEIARLSAGKAAHPFFARVATSASAKGNSGLGSDGGHQPAWLGGDSRGSLQPMAPCHITQWDQQGTPWQPAWSKWTLRDQSDPCHVAPYEPVDPQCTDPPTPLLRLVNTRNRSRRDGETRTPPTPPPTSSTQPSDLVEPGDEERRMESSPEAGPGGKQEKRMELASKLLSPMYSYIKAQHCDMDGRHHGATAGDRARSGQSGASIPDAAFDSAVQRLQKYLAPSNATTGRENFGILSGSCLTQSESGTGSPENTLWTDKYQPNRSQEVCGNAGPVEAVKDWLASWRTRILSQRRDAGALNSDAKKGTNGNAPDSDDDDDDSWLRCISDLESDGEDDGLPNTLLLTGPVGCGKTAAVYACARELGFNVIEINASDCRSGPLIKHRFGEATESHGLTTWSRSEPPTIPSNPLPSSPARPIPAPASDEAKPSSVKPSAKPATNGSKAKESTRAANGGRLPAGQPAPEKPGSRPPPSARRKGRPPTNGKSPSTAVDVTPGRAKLPPVGIPSGGLAEIRGLGSDLPGGSSSAANQVVSLVLFEEVDTLLDEDRGFIAALSHLAARKKRPIILTSNVARPPLPPVLLKRQLDFQAPSAADLLLHSAVVSAAERLDAPPCVLDRLVHACGSDLRRLLLCLQFWSQLARCDSPSAGTERIQGGKEDHRTMDEPEPARREERGREREEGLAAGLGASGDEDERGGANRGAVAQEGAGSDSGIGARGSVKRAANQEAAGRGSTQWQGEGRGPLGRSGQGASVPEEAANGGGESEAAANQNAAFGSPVGHPHAESAALTPSADGEQAPPRTANGGADLGPSTNDEAPVASQPANPNQCAAGEQPVNGRAAEPCLDDPAQIGQKTLSHMETGGDVEATVGPAEVTQGGGTRRGVAEAGHEQPEEREVSPGWAGGPHKVPRLPGEGISGEGRPALQGRGIAGRTNKEAAALGKVAPGEVDLALPLDGEAQSRLAGEPRPEVLSHGDIERKAAGEGREVGTGRGRLRGGTGGEVEDDVEGLDWPVELLQLLECDAHQRVAPQLLDISLPCLMARAVDEKIVTAAREEERAAEVEAARLGIQVAAAEQIRRDTIAQARKEDREAKAAERRAQSVERQKARARRVAEMSDGEERSGNLLTEADSRELEGFKEGFKGEGRKERLEGEEEVGPSERRAGSKGTGRGAKRGRRGGSRQGGKRRTKTGVVLSDSEEDRCGDHAGQEGTDELTDGEEGLGSGGGKGENGADDEALEPSKSLGSGLGLDLGLGLGLGLDRKLGFADGQESRAAAGTEARMGTDQGENGEMGGGAADELAKDKNATPVISPEGGELGETTSPVSPIKKKTREDEDLESREAELGIRVQRRGIKKMKLRRVGEQWSLERTGLVEPFHHQPANTPQADESEGGSPRDEEAAEDLAANASLPAGWAEGSDGPANDGEELASQAEGGTSGSIEPLPAGTAEVDSKCPNGGGDERGSRRASSVPAGELGGGEGMGVEGENEAEETHARSKGGGLEPEAEAEAEAEADVAASGVVSQAVGLQGEDVPPARLQRGSSNGGGAGSERVAGDGEPSLLRSSSGDVGSAPGPARGDVGREAGTGTSDVMDEACLAFPGGGRKGAGAARVGDDVDRGPRPACGDVATRRRAAECDVEKDGMGGGVIRMGSSDATDAATDGGKERGKPQEDRGAESDEVEGTEEQQQQQQQQQQGAIMDGDSGHGGQQGQREPGLLGADLHGTRPRLPNMSLGAKSSRPGQAFDLELRTGTHLQPWELGSEMSAHGQQLDANLELGRDILLRQSWEQPHQQPSDLPPSDLNLPAASAADSPQEPQEDEDEGLGFCSWLDQPESFEDEWAGGNPAAVEAAWREMRSSKDTWRDVIGRERAENGGVVERVAAMASDWSDCDVLCGWEHAMAEAEAPCWHPSAPSPRPQLPITSLPFASSASAAECAALLAHSSLATCLSCCLPPGAGVSTRGTLPAPSDLLLAANEETAAGNALARWNDGRACQVAEMERTLQPMTTPAWRVGGAPLRSQKREELHRCLQPIAPPNVLPSQTAVVCDYAGFAGRMARLEKIQLTAGVSRKRSRGPLSSSLSRSLHVEEEVLQDLFLLTSFGR